MSSSPRCAFLIKWVKSYALIQLTIFEGSQTILRIKDCKKMTWWRKLQLMKQASNQEIQRTNWTQEDMMIRAKKCFKWNKEAPQGSCTNLIFLHLNTICTNMESSLPIYHLKYNHKHEINKRVDTLIKLSFCPKTIHEIWVREEAKIINKHS
jgi:hypothetical protein